jgi:hypothetical protein
MKFLRLLFSMIGVLGSAAAAAQPLPIAVLDLDADGKELTRAAKEVTDLLTAGLRFA